MNKVLYIDQSPTGTGLALRHNGQVLTFEFPLDEKKTEIWLDSTTIRVNEPNGTRYITAKKPSYAIGYREDRPDGSVSYNLWRHDKDKNIWIKLKNKIEKRKYTDEERVRILYAKLNGVIKKFGITEIIYEATGSVPKRWDQKQNKFVSAGNVKTLLKLGQIESVLMVVAHTNKLKATRTIRAQSHQKWVRDMILASGRQVNVEEKWNSKKKSYDTRHLTKQDSIMFASLVLKSEIKSDNIADAVSMLFYDEAQRKKSI